MSSKEEQAYIKRKRGQWTCALLYLLMWIYIMLSFVFGGYRINFAEPKIIGSHLRIEFRSDEEDSGQYVLFQKHLNSDAPKLYHEKPDKERLEEALDCRVLILDEVEAVDEAISSRDKKYSVDIDLDEVEYLENINADDRFYFAVYVEKAEDKDIAQWDRVWFEDVTPLVNKYLQRQNK